LFSIRWDEVQDGLYVAVDAQALRFAITPMMNEQTTIRTKQITGTHSNKDLQLVVHTLDAPQVLAYRYRWHIFAQLDRTFLWKDLGT
jgi:hypothetical protein